MGVAIVISPCICCGRLFNYNPHRVPSMVIRGEREPVCQDCIDRANPIREANGLPPIVPLPGAYDAIEDGDL